MYRYCYCYIEKTAQIHMYESFNSMFVLFQLRKIQYRVKDSG